MNNLTQFTTVQIIEELIRRNLISFTRYPLKINITEEFINELSKDDNWEKWLNPKCRECKISMASGDLCWECSEKLKTRNHD
jgi:hypothetical protein